MSMRCITTSVPGDHSRCIAHQTGRLKKGPIHPGIYHDSVSHNDEENPRHDKQALSLEEGKHKHTLLERTVRELVFQIRVHIQPLVQQADELSV